MIRTAAVFVVAAIAVWLIGRQLDRWFPTKG